MIGRNSFINNWKPFALGANLSPAIKLKLYIKGNNDYKVFTYVYPYQDYWLGLFMNALVIVYAVDVYPIISSY